MRNISQLETYYKKYTQSLHEWIPEGIYQIDLALLYEFELLSFYRPEYRDPTLTRYFHVIESSEKITLINDEFIVWIVSDNVKTVSMTYILVAINRPDFPKLELAFTASGVYNSSRIILRTLERFLINIQETEHLLRELETN